MREILAATYTEHRQGLFSLALSVTGDRQLAEDAVQSAFEKLIRLSASPNGNPVAYVFSAVRNAAHDCVHRNGSPRQSLFVDCVDCEAVTPEASAEADERLAAVQAAVMNLEDEEVSLDLIIQLLIDLLVAGELEAVLFVEEELLDPYFVLVDAEVLVLLDEIGDQLLPQRLLILEPDF